MSKLWELIRFPEIDRTYPSPISSTAKSKGTFYFLNRSIHQILARMWSLPKRRRLPCGHFLLGQCSNFTAAH